MLKLKRLDFLSNQSWAAHKGCLLILGEQLSGLLLQKWTTRLEFVMKLKAVRKFCGPWS